MRAGTATRRLITADAGGANGYRVRAWKTELAGFAHASGLQVTVCHFPPGTWKWNKIEHRRCSRISSNWHLELHPASEPPAPPPVPRDQDRTQPQDRAPDWLHHPTLIGMDTHAFADLLAAVEQELLDHPPISLHHKRARHRILRRGPLPLSDRLLVTVLRHRWNTQIRSPC